MAGELVVEFENAARPIGDGLFLVLDDYHVITESSTQDLLAFFLKYPPPIMRFILIARQDPPFSFIHFRAKQRMTEIRASDLKFSRSEILELLR